MTDKLRLLSQNIRGLRDFAKRKGAFQFFRSKCDIALVQETYSNEEDERLWKIQWGDEAIFSHGTNKSKGCIILYKQAKVHVIKEIKDTDGRFCGIIFYINECPILVMNIYAPNEPKDNCKFFRKIRNYLQELQEEFIGLDVIIGGDFNFVENEDLDRSNPSNHSRESQDVFIQIRDMFSVSDCHRDLHPFAKEYTWRRTKPVLTQARLDRFYLPESLGHTLKSSTIIHGYKSDHSAIQIELEFYRRNERGIGHWKINASIFEDEIYPPPLYLRSNTSSFTPLVLNSLKTSLILLSYCVRNCK